MEEVVKKEEIASNKKPSGFYKGKGVVQFITKVDYILKYFCHDMTTCWLFLD